MSDDPYIRRFRLLRVVDGDSIHATVDKGYRDYGDESIRLLEVDTHEINKGTVEDRAKGMEARSFAVVWFTQHQSHGESPKWPFWVASEKSDSFDRWLGDVYCECGSHLAAELRDAGHDTGRRWTGVNTLRTVEEGGA